MNWLAALIVSAQASVATPVINHSCLKTCDIDQAGYEFLYRVEGSSPVVYYDVAGHASIGVGHMLVAGESFTRPLTPDEIEALLRQDAKRFAKAVDRQVNVPIMQNQFDALTSFTFNLGEHALANSTLLRFVNGGEEGLVPGEFPRWCHAGGKVNTGLLRRRQQEAEMYVG